MDLHQDALEVAPKLLGAVFSHGAVAVRLTEVEAYRGRDDPASHGYRGPTPRSAVMFGPAGHLYCYLSHGVHVCANVVCGPVGTSSAVLLRGGEVVAGLELARRRRGNVSDARLARGPGCLGRALGLSLSNSGAEIEVESSGGVPPDETEVDGGFSGFLLTFPASPLPRFASGPRVGVSAAAEHPWRFWIPGDPTVSAYRRSPRAASSG